MPPPGGAPDPVASTGCLGKVAPDAKAGEYQIARLWLPHDAHYSAGLAAALAASLALSAAAFFSTKRTDQIEPS